MTTEQLDQVVAGYIEAMLWAEYDANEDTPDDCLDGKYSVEDVAAESVEAIRQDVKTFTEGAVKRGLITIDGDGFRIANDADYADKGGSLEALGHDIHLNRRGHGAGFWDRGYGPNGDALSDLAHSLGNTYCWAEHGRVHMERG